MEYAHPLNRNLLFFLMIISLLLPVYAIGADRMPEFSLASAVDGKLVNSSDFKGKVVLVTFFATWCSPCRQEVPSLIKLQKKFGPREFSVIGLSMDKKAASVSKLIEKEEINYPVLMSADGTDDDFGGVIGIPTSFLYNRQGELIQRYPGYAPYSMLENDIKSVF